MNKEQFMRIAEEEGIASSDWREDLWLRMEKKRGVQAYLTLLTTGFPEGDE